MRITLFGKIALNFLIIAIGSILIATIISNYMIDERFNSYLKDEHVRKVERMKKTIETLYDKQAGFSESDFEEIMRYAVMEDFYIEVKDINNNPILSSGKTHLTSKKITDSMIGKGIDTNLEEYIEEKYSLLKGKEVLGTIIIGHYGTFSMNEEDLGFKDTLNKAHIISITAALAFGLFMSLILSGQLVKPLIKLTKVANEIRGGDLTARSEIITNTTEIYDLSQSVNYLAETLQQQEVLRKRLTSDMAHEIRTPLSTLKTHMEALIDGVWDPTVERFESCYEEIQRLAKLVDNLKEIAKIEQTNLKINKERFKISKEVEKIIETMKPLYSKKKLEIEFVNNLDLEVVMDKDKLKQIMHNLLSNSYKYSNDNGQVKVSMGKKENNIFIEVKDNGIGISKDDLPFIFERFYRGDISRSRKTGGTGIGLTIVKALVESHGGKIEVESELNKGSTFVLMFPMNLIANDKV